MGALKRRTSHGDTENTELVLFGSVASVTSGFVTGDSEA
jgi:hypothetical protein